MNEDHRDGNFHDTLPGETVVPLLHGPLTRAEQIIVEEKREKAAEKAAEEAYKERQLALAGSANRLSKTNVILTWILAVFTAIGAGAAWYQGRVASRAATAAENAAKATAESVYMACLSAQATQKTFLQMQIGALDAHATTVATIEQTTANLFAERAVIEMSTRLPLPQEIFNNQFRLPYTLSNTGHSVATIVQVRVKAVLLLDRDPLRFTPSNYEVIVGRHIPPANVSPSKAAGDPRFSPVIADLAVRDIEGKTLTMSEPRVRAFYKGSPQMVVVYGDILVADFSGSHKTRFCTPHIVVGAGIMRLATTNEKTCNKYNFGTDNFASIPKLTSLATPKLLPIDTISCKDPNE